MKETIAYLKGKEAGRCALSHIKYEPNPYEVGSVAWVDWKDGFNYMIIEYGDDHG